jgi:multiple sugar transport system ATP-binding protein
MEIYDTPANLFTAGFMGTPKMNFAKARLSDDGADVLAYGITLPVAPAFRDAARRAMGRDVILGLRSEHVGATHEVDWASDCHVTGTVELIEPLGHEGLVFFEVQGQSISGRLRSHAALPSPGEPITLQIKSEAMHLFDPTSEKRLA